MYSSPDLRSPAAEQQSKEASVCYFCLRDEAEHIGEHKACPDLQLNGKAPDKNQRYKPLKCAVQKQKHLDCGACPGDGSMCKAACRFASESPTVEGADDSESLVRREYDAARRALSICNTLTPGPFKAKHNARILRALKTLRAAA